MASNTKYFVSSSVDCNCSKIMKKKFDENDTTCIQSTYKK